MVVERRGYSPAESGLVTEAPYPPDIPQEHFQIAFHTSIEPSREVETLISGVDNFARRVSTRFGTQVLSWMDETSTLPHSIDLHTYDYVKTHGLYMPSFDIYDALTAEDFLKSTNFTEGEIDDDGLLMVFNLPQPLAHYWWLVRGFEAGNDHPCKKWSENAIEYDPTVVREKINAGKFSPIPPWGRAYHGMRDIFWDELERKRSHHPFDFERIGEKGDHDAAKYYYIFALWPTSSELAESGTIFSPYDVHGRAS